MDGVYKRCCGLDIHKRTIVACIMVPNVDATPTKQIRTFGTMTEELLQLADWLTLHQVTHVAMESTGVDGTPSWNVLEGRFALLLVNAQRSTAVPGRKTDVRDVEWIADLRRHGLLQPSFAPDRAQRELRELTRSRTSLIQARTARLIACNRRWREPISNWRVSLRVSWVHWVGRSLPLQPWWPEQPTQQHWQI